MNVQSNQGTILQDLWQSLPSPVVVVDENNKILNVNGAAEEFFSLSETLLCRMKLSDIAPFTSPLFTAVSRLRETGTSLSENGVKIGTPRTGGERLVDVQAAVVVERPGTIILLIVEKSFAQALDRQRNNLQAARSVSGMASMLAHEIKNPLSGIRGAAQLLETSASEQDKELTALICDETDRIRALVDQMEVFSDHRPPQMEPLNVHTILEHVRKVASTGFASEIEFTENYDPSLPLVNGNRDQLIQVFLNLVKNAAEATNGNEGAGKINLSTAFRPGFRMQVPGSDTAVSLPLEIAVKDNGSGIAPELIENLFDPFVSSKDSGQGLGLALVAKLVRDHGGIVDALSSHSGADFRVMLPVTFDQEGKT